MQGQLNHLKKMMIDRGHTSLMLNIRIGQYHTASAAPFEPQLKNFTAKKSEI